MTFKLRSTVSVYEYPSSEKNTEGTHHVVLSRERQLRSGEIIQVGGSVARDEEAKRWKSANGQIRIIDGETLSIRWRRTMLDSLLQSAFSGPERVGVGELRKWEPEREVKGRTPLVLEDIYHSEPIFAEVFTVTDRFRIKSLVERKLQEIKGTKSVKRKTELIYEP